MFFIQGFLLVILASFFIILFAGPKSKGIVAVVSVVLLSIISGIVSVGSLSGNTFSLLLKGSLVTGPVPVVVDPLSAWFILIINFTFITGAVYGSGYMEAYSDRRRNLSLHWISYLFAQASLLSVCVLQNSLVFLIAWEIMALSTFFLVIFEGEKAKTIKAGMNYLIQSHVAILLLVIAFVRVFVSQGTTGFDAIHQFALQEKPGSALVLMLLFFAGFGFKSGFVPFHTWLPHAHPAAPSHVSGMMSGVLIKIGIYGILRMIFLLEVNYTETGYFILVVSVITGIYGVMLAIVQHNLKRLLAYHSIENIGIIGIGIGLGCIGLGQGSEALALLGFAGALLHTLNHSLFKSLLFYSAGNVYQAIHTMNVEKSGGLIRKMPHTALLFLIAALAICGLPPFNGFVSEFILFSGLFKGIQTSAFPLLLVIISTLFGLSLIGGLAVLCFTKAFGIIFLGTPRVDSGRQATEGSWQKLIPMYLIAVFILLVGIFPQWFIHALVLPLEQLTNLEPGSFPAGGLESLDTVRQIGFYSLGFILVVLLVFLIRKRLTAGTTKTQGETWGCGYVAPSAKMQYTASSFVRSYSKLAGSLLSFSKVKKEVSGIFPAEAGLHTVARDKTEEYFIVLPVDRYKKFLEKFSFLQNGKLQYYIFYGMLFILLFVVIPLIINLFSH